MHQVRDHGLGEVRLSEVARQNVNFAMPVFERLLCLPQSIAIYVDKQDSGACIHQLFRDRSAYASSRSRDNRRFVLE
jgi:hypothetical protein